jgi:N-sulfoglucosamine sulfohydrolase
MYLQTVQIVDDRVGAVLERLEDEELADNTIVVFFADQGRAHLRAKQWLYEGGIHVPLIIRWPGRAQAGAVSDDLVSLIDLGPMSLAMCGVEDGFDTQGRPFALPGAETIGPVGSAFAPARRRYVFAARDRCDETSDRIRAVRSERYKYIRNFHPERPCTSFNIYKESQYPALAVMRTMHARGELTGDAAAFMADRRPAEELYDLTVDPHELHNLADHEDHTGALRELRAALDDWIDRTGDRGATPEPQSEIDRWQAWSAKRTPQRYKGKFGLPADCTAADRLRAWYRIAGLPVPPEQPTE